MGDIYKGQPSILKIAQLGNPVLRIPAAPLTDQEILHPSTSHFIDSMIATMREYNGAGLAAPQVSFSKQIIVIESRENRGGDFPLTILLNPKIVEFSKDLAEGWEGCLSLKDLWGKVKRSTRIKVEAKTREGKNIDIKAEGFFAIVLQHEIDHLYGKVFVDRMEDMTSLCFTAEYNKYMTDEL
ncbi:MAG: peptide deformylase [Nitrospinota bacterium]|nr:peptide deformylase [Nitrospinota bacterium]